MSGGSHDYVYCTLANELRIPSGHYGLSNDGEYAENVIETRRIDPMEDEELSEMMYDVSCLLHSLEWYCSGDNREERYIKDKERFKNKWLRNAERPVTDKERMIEETCDRLERMLMELKEQ